MATPFEQAGDLFYHTATNSALQDLGRQGEVNAQRAFEMRAQQNQADLQQRNRLSEMSAEETNREKFASTEAERVKGESAKAKFATAQQINPDWKPDSSKTLEQNMAAADKVGEDKTVQAAKSITDQQNQIQQSVIDKIKAAGLPPNIDTDQLNGIVASKLVQDPDFIRSLSPAKKQALQNFAASQDPSVKASSTPEQLAALKANSISPQELINSMVSGRFAGWAEGLGTGFNPNQTAANLAQKAQQYRQDAVTQFHQANVNAVGYEAQQQMSRYNELNEAKQKIIAAVPAHRLNEVLQYQSSNQQPGPFQALSSQSPAGVNPNVFNALGGGTGTPPAPPDPNAAPPGTNPVFDPKTYQNQADLIANSAALRGEQTDLSDKQQQADALRGILLKGSTPAKSSPYNPYMPQMSTPEPSGDMPITPEHGREIALKLLKLNKEIEGHKKNIGNFQSNIFQLQPTPPTPETPPPGQRWNVPANIIQPQQTQPAAQPAPQGQPQASNGTNGSNAFQMVAIQNKLQQVFGTNNQNVLAAARNIAKSQGQSDDQINQGLQAAMNGDPNAIAQARRFISMAQQQNNGQMAQTPLAQPSYP